MPVAKGISMHLLVLAVASCCEAQMRRALIGCCGYERAHLTPNLVRFGPNPDPPASFGPCAPVFAGERGLIKFEMSLDKRRGAAMLGTASLFKFELIGYCW